MWVRWPDRPIPYGVRRTVAELLALVRDRKRSFLEYGIAVDGGVPAPQVRR